MASDSLVPVTANTYDSAGRQSTVGAGTSETWYNYTVGFDVVSTEDDADGRPTRTTSELSITR